MKECLKNSIRMYLVWAIGILASINLFFMMPRIACGGPYLDSAHGKAAYGVSRISVSGFGYSKGNCANCHEQHSSINMSEPEPTGGPDKFGLFYRSYTNQTDNFCLKCHCDTVSSLQSAGVLNRSYSYRAGGETLPVCPDTVSGSFSFIDETGASVANCSSSTGSAHKLTDIQTFIKGRWAYPAEPNPPNPCIACHNPHMAQGDPADANTSAKSQSSRGWPVSRPSLYSKDSKTWGLWGDSGGETMRGYTFNYQAPYRVGSLTYEPDGSIVQDGSNLTDFVTFCTDCHNSTNTIYSNLLDRDLRKIDWSGSGDKHGAKDGTGSTTPPYTLTMNYVLACTDCHEPHGSPNPYLLRTAVNGAGGISVTSTRFFNLCSACHTVSFATPAGHVGKDSNSDCYVCHYHGASSEF